MEGMASSSHTQPGTESGAASHTVTSGDIPADSQGNLASINTDGKLSKRCTSFTSRGASKFIQTNHKVMNTCTIFIHFSTLCVLILFILTT